MNKSELIDKVASDLGETKAKAKKAVESVFKNISDSLSHGNPVRLVGFGTFGTRKREARVARNPRTGQKISIKARKVPFFKAGKELKEKVK